MMGTQLYNDSVVPQHHKYAAHQVALLYVSAVGGGAARAAGAREGDRGGVGGEWRSKRRIAACRS
jgi:hypothetical protein